MSRVLAYRLALAGGLALVVSAVGLWSPLIALGAAGVFIAGAGLAGLAFDGSPE